MTISAPLFPDTDEEHLGKLSYYAQPESLYDNFPIRKAAESQVFELEVLSNCGAVEVEDLLRQLKQQGFVVVRVPEAHAKVWETLRASLVPFFDSEEKKAYQTPSTDSCGYKQLYFPNRDNIRDPEDREVFQYYAARHKQSSFRWPDATIQNLFDQAYDLQFGAAVSILTAIATGLKVNPMELLSLAGVTDAHVQVGNFDKLTSENTNMCVFHYFDNRGYSSLQKCMAHEDDSLVTLVPRSTYPGLHILDHAAKEWMDAEFALPDDRCMAVYPGRILSLLTGDSIRATTHRVVRAPRQTRYSMPFLFKPNQQSVLQRLHSEVLPEERSQDEKEGREVPMSVNGYPLDTQLPITYHLFRTGLGWEKTQRKLARELAFSGHESSPPEMPSLSRQLSHKSAQEQLMSLPEGKIPSDMAQEIKTTMNCLSHE